MLVRDRMLYVAIATMVCALIIWRGLKHRSCASVADPAVGRPLGSRDREVSSDEIVVLATSEGEVKRLEVGILTTAERAGVTLHGWWTRRRWATSCGECADPQMRD